MTASLMDIFKRHAAPKLAETGISKAAQDMAQLSLATAFIPGRGTRIDHPYISAAAPQDIEIESYGSGIYAVRRTKDMEGAMVEAFTTRMAALAGLPVAPVFLDPRSRRVDREMDSIDTLSVVPFARLHVQDMAPLSATKVFSSHASTIMPFLLTLGATTDRSPHNIVAGRNDDHGPLRLAEFDFAYSDLCSLITPHLGTFQANVDDRKTLLNQWWDNRDMPYRPALRRDGFVRGIDAIAPHEPATTHKVLDMLPDALFQQRYKDRIAAFMGERKTRVMSELEKGRLDRRFKANEKRAFDKPKAREVRIYKFP